MGEKKALWRTINFEYLSEVVNILGDIDGFRALPEGKHSTYYRQCLTPEMIMEYAEEVADDDDIWNKIPENWKIKFSEEEKRNFEIIKRIFYSKEMIDIERCSTESSMGSRDMLRKRLRQLIILCDQNIGR